MQNWQADFYRRPLKDASGHPLWELLVCDRSRSIELIAQCPQSEANAQWLVQQLKPFVATHKLDVISVFRPQCLSLLETAGQQLGIRVEPNRRTPTLKQWLQERTQSYQESENYTGEPYEPVILDQPPPLPLPENLWGERWRFATLSARELVEAFSDRPIPILEMPDFLLPLNLGLPSTLPIPGVVIDGGRQSMRFARWLEEIKPVALNYKSGSPDGLILEAGLVDRWIIATFEDEAVRKSGDLFEQRKQVAQGLHFLLIQPDDSGMTYSGFWFLQNPD